mgnify:CR=1 FL=1
MEGLRWYAIQTYSGHENKVLKLIERKIAEEPGEELEEKEIQNALVPTQDVVEIRNGKRVTVTHGMTAEISRVQLGSGPPCCRASVSTGRPCTQRLYATMTTGSRMPETKYSTSCIRKKP